MTTSTSLTLGKRKQDENDGFAPPTRPFKFTRSDPIVSLSGRKEDPIPKMASLQPENNDADDPVDLVCVRHTPVLSYSC